MAGQVSGVDIKVGLYKETTYGADPGSPTGRVAYVSSLGITSDSNLIDTPIITGGRGRRKPGTGNQAVAGSIETTMAPETIGFWLTQLLGAPTTTGSSIYTHVFRPTTLPVGFIVEKDYTSKIASKVERFNGLRIASGEMKFSQEGFCTLALQCIGQKHTINAAVLDATLDDPGHNGWTGFSGIVKKAGTQIAGVTDFTIRVDNNMPGGPYCFPASGATAGVRYSNPEGRASISGSITMVFEDFTLIDAAIAGTDTALTAELAFGTGLGSAGNEKCTFTVDHSLLARRSPPLDTESGIMLTMDYTGFASGATDMGLIVTLMNAISGTAL